MEFTDALLQWYDRHKRTLPWRGAGDAYAVLVSEIMLQQTRAAAVIPYYGRFMNELPTVEALAACDEVLLEEMQGTGRIIGFGVKDGVVLELMDYTK